MIMPRRRSLKRNFLRGLFLCKKALLLGVDKQKEICEAKHPLKTSPDYCRAQKIARTMLDAGLINEHEFEKLSDINRETFSPLFAEIYPKTACYVSGSE